MSSCFRTNKILLPLWICCLCLPLARAQKAAPELRRTADYYKSLPGFSVKVSASFYTGETSANPAKKLSGSVEISGNLSHAIFDGRESLMGKDFVLVADHGNRSIYYSPRGKESKNSVSSGTEMLDSAFLSKYTVTAKEVNETLMEYRLVPKKAGGEFRSIGIRINRKRHILDEITYLYAGDVKFKKVVIKYYDFNADWKPEKTYFSEAKFISGRQKTARLQPAFSTYQLINSFNYDPKKNLIEQ